MIRPVPETEAVVVIVFEVVIVTEPVIEGVEVATAVFEAVKDIVGVTVWLAVFDGVFMLDLVTVDVRVLVREDV